MRNIFLLVFLIGFTSSCSKEEVFYYFGDWLIDRKVSQYMKLNRSQKKELSKVSKSYMAWHKNKMLPRYNGFLSNLKEVLGRPTLSENEFGSLIKDFDNLYAETFTYYYHGIIPLMVKLSEKMIW